MQKFSDSKLGALDSEIELPKESDLRSVLDKWLSEPHAKKSSRTSYIPKLVILTDTTMVNFVGETVVYSVRKSRDDVWTQFTWPSDSRAKEVQMKLLDFIDNNETKEAKHP